MKLRDSRGMSLVEVLLAVAVFALIASGVVGAVVYGREGPATVGTRNRANMIAKEGIEAVRSIDYNALAVGTYGLSASGSTWALSGSSDLVDGIFTRSISISVVDGKTKQAVVSVSYNLNGQRAITSSLATRLTAWQWSWQNGVQDTSLDLTAAVSTSDGKKVKVLGDYAYMIRTNTTNDLRIIQIANNGIPLANPVDVGGKVLTSAPTNIAVGTQGAKTFAMISESGGNPEVEIFDVTTPASIGTAIALNPAGNTAANTVAFDGTYVYFGRPSVTLGNQAEFYVFLASNLGGTVPSQVATADYGLITATGINDMAVLTGVVSAGDCYAYLSTSATTNQVQVIDCTTRTSGTVYTPTNVATIGGAAGSSINAYAVSGTDIRLQAGTGSNLYALKLSVPTGGTIVASAALAVGSAVTDVSKDSLRHYAFVSSAATGAEFQAINIATITAGGALSVLKSIKYTPTTDTALNGLSYNQALDRVVAVGVADTQELTVYSPR